MPAPVGYTDKHVLARLIMGAMGNDRAAWLRGPEASCAVKPPELAKPYRLVLLGAPGVGKGTQAELLMKQTQACHLSTGDVFRAAKSAAEKNGGLTPAMNVAVACMKAGRLVPDVTVVEMVKERVECLKCKGGFILDGFPRTVPQAEELEKMLREHGLKLDGVLDYVMPMEQIVARLSGRRTCVGCKAVYHVANRPPKVENVCDACGKALMQRDDDRPEAVKIRMSAYEWSTAPLTAFYKARNLLVQVEAIGTPEEIFARAMGKLEGARG
jgi:adenylate kinase